MPKTLSHRQRKDEDSSDDETQPLNSNSQNQDDTPSLDPDRMPSYFQIGIIIAWQTLAVTNFTYVIPTSVEFAEYLGSTKVFAGLLIAMCGFLSFLSALPFYMVVNKVGIKNGFLICTSMFIIGMFLYIVACPTKSLGLLIVSRGFGGIGTQMFATWYTAVAVGINKRSFINQLINTATAAGYTLGPLLAGLMFYLTKNDITGTVQEGGTWEYKNKWWNRITSPGWLILAITIVLFLTEIFFQKEPTATRKSQKQIEDTTKVSVSPMKAFFNLPSREKWSFYINLITVFLLPMVVAAWEVHAINVGMEDFGWETYIAAIYVGCVFVVIIPSNAILAYYLHNKVHMSDRAGMIIFGVMAVLGHIGLYDFFPNSEKKHQTASVAIFTVGSFFILLGFNLARGYQASLMSKQVPGAAKGLGNTWAFMAYLLGRGVGALIADLFKADERNYFVICFQGICFVVVLAWVLSWKLMKPSEVGS